MAKLDPAKLLQQGLDPEEIDDLLDDEETDERRKEKQKRRPKRDKEE